MSCILIELFVLQSRKNFQCWFIYIYEITISRNIIKLVFKITRFFFCFSVFFFFTFLWWIIQQKRKIQLKFSSLMIEHFLINIATGCLIFSFGMLLFCIQLQLQWIMIMIIEVTFIELYSDLIAELLVSHSHMFVLFF